MGSENRRALIASKLMKKGYTEDETTAILANMDVETGGSFDPSTKQRGVGKVKDWWKPSRGGRGTGLIQWDGSRRVALKKFAEERGKTWDDLDTQVDFLDHELKTSEKRGMSKVRQAQDAESKATAFSKYVERPGKPHLERRKKAARKLKKRNTDAKGKYLFGGPSLVSPTESINEESNQLMRLDSMGNKLPEEEIARERAKSKADLIAAQGQAQQKQVGEQMMAQDPKSVKEVVKNLPELDSSTAREVNKDIDAKVKGKPRQGGVASQFTEALTFFLPQMIGGLAGAAFEGDEGAIAGIEAGGQMRDAFLANQMERAKLEATSGKSALDQRRVEIAEANLGLRGQKLQIEEKGEKRREKQLGLNFKKFALDEKKTSQLSDKQVTSLQDIDTTLQAIDRIAQLKEGVNTGPIAGSIGTLLERIDEQPEGFTELKSATNESLATYVKSISGAQVSELEAQRLGQIIPNVNDNDETFKRKLKSFKEILERNKQAFVQAVASGQPLRKIQGLDEALGQKPQAGGSSIMTPEQKARLQELRKKFGKQ